MFDLFKAKKLESFDSKLGTGKPIITALLLQGDNYPVEVFLKQVAKVRIAGKAVSGIRCGEGTVFSFDVGDEFFALTHIPCLSPDLDGPIATTWMWPPRPSIEEVKRHRSHLLITMMGGAADPVKKRLVMTAVTSLAAKQPGVMAVFLSSILLALGSRNEAVFILGLGLPPSSLGWLFPPS
ncbi:MAG: hypothetical protein DDT32_01943 [Syntrophomonadaceae bacterium]|nr:hypothetical protein [Bacillota bacterium]